MPNIYSTANIGIIIDIHFGEKKGWNNLVKTKSRTTTFLKVLNSNSINNGQLATILA